MLEYKDYTIDIKQDDDPESPREWDNLGKMVLFHRRMNLGDKHDFTPETLQDYLKTEKSVYLWVYAYEHGGITISTGRDYPYNDQWDSGTLGAILVSREDILKEYNCKRISPKTMAKIINVLQAEVNAYDQYLTGDVWGYMITSPIGEELDSCWGYYGQGYCETEAKSMVDWYIKDSKIKI